MQRLDTMIRLAKLSFASALHFRQEDDKVEIQLLIDDSFYKLKSLPEDEKIIGYLRHKAGIEKYKFLTPQTGAFEITVDNEVLKLRLATMDYKNSVIAVLRFL